MPPAKFSPICGVQMVQILPSVSAEPFEDTCTASSTESLAVYHIRQPLGCFLFCALMAMLWRARHQECGPEYLGMWLGSGIAY